MNCKICNVQITQVEVINNINYCFCNNCDFVFKDLASKLSKKEEEERYLQHNNSIKDLKYVAYLNNFINLTIIPFYTKGLLLDYGCGPNPVLGQLLANNYEVEVYDPFFFPDKAYSKHKYDIITTTEVIEHVDDIIAFLEHLKSLLKDDGIICIMTQFNNYNLNQFKSWFYIRDITHIAFLNLTTFKYLANQLNLEIIKTNNKNFVVLKEK